MSCQTTISLLCRNSIVREGLSRILAEKEFKVVNSSSTAAVLRGVGETATETCDLVLLDNGADECDVDAIAAVQRRYPSSKLVMLVDQFDFRIMLKAFQLGVRAYIVKEISCDRLMGTLQLVAMGERVLPSQLADELQSHPGLAIAPDAKKLADLVELSAREMEVLRWLMMGCPNKVISRCMDISEATVKVHVKAVLRKLSVKNRTQAAIWGANHGMTGRTLDSDFDLADVPHPAALPAASAGALDLMHA